MDAGKLSGQEIKKVTDVMKTNTAVNKFTMRGKNLGKEVKEELRKEILKNQSIF